MEFTVGEKTLEAGGPEPWCKEEELLEFVNGMNEPRSSSIAQVLKAQIRAENFRLNYETLKNLHLRYGQGLQDANQC